MITRLLALLLIMVGAWAETEPPVLRFQDLKREEIAPGVKFSFLGPDGTTRSVASVTRVLPPGGRVDFEFVVIDNEPVGRSGGTRPTVGAGGPATAGPGRGTSKSTGGTSAAGVGIAAGVTHGAIKGVYQGVLMTPARERELKAALRAQAAAEASRDITVAELNRLRQANDELSRVAKAEIIRSLDTPKLNLRPKPWNVPTTMMTGDARFDGRAGPIARRLHEARPRNVAERDLRDFGNSALEVGADAFRTGEFGIADSALEFAREAADLLVGLDPWTGTVRSGYELFTGRNLITGATLSPFHRAISGVIFSTSLLTGGVAATVGEGVRAGARIFARATSTEAKVGAEALAEGAEIIERLSAAGWSTTQIQEFAEFTRNTLGDQIQNLEYAIAAAEDWSLSAKMSFPAVLRELNGSTKELSLMAEHLGVDVTTLTERRAMAIGFYNNAPKVRNQPTLNETLGEISDHIRGIDFTKEVSVVKLPAGSKILSWSHPERGVGDYFALEKTKPEALGIGPLGKHVGGDTISKELREYELVSEARALKSTSAEIHDAFSIHDDSGIFIDSTREGVIMEGHQYAHGGKTQYFVPAKNVRRVR